MKSSYYVYAHKTADTGEVFYVGKGAGNRSRQRRNRNAFWKNIALKHGFTVEILKDGMEESEAFEFEKESIAKYNPRANLTVGGEGTSGYKHRQELVAWRNQNNRNINLTEEGRRKKSEAQRIAQNRPEVVEKRRLGFEKYILRLRESGKHHHSKGRRRTQEEKARISSSQKGEKGFWFGKTTVVAKRVKNLDTQEIFNSIKKAAASVQGHPSALKRRMKIGAPFKGFLFAFCETE